MAFGELLQEIRVAKKVSLRDLGRAVKLSATYISDIEGGQRKPPIPAIIIQMAESLKTDAMPLLRAALQERNSVELALSGDEATSEKRNFVLALARTWDTLDDKTLETLTRLIERDNDAEEGKC